MESIWTTATGHWHMAQCPPAEERNKLLEIVSLARQTGIPTVFWMTKNYVYHEHYKDFASHFDFVFCADPNEAEKMRTEGVHAELLLPCARQVENIDQGIRTIPIIFDGWADLDKYTVDFNILNRLNPLGLKIIESRYQIFKRRAEVLAEYKEQIIGCVTRQGRLAALASSQCYITFEKTLSTTTTQQWMALEALGLGVQVAHLGNISSHDPRFTVVSKTNDWEEFQQIIEEKIYPPIKNTENKDSYLLFNNTLTYADRVSRLINMCF
jgi:hypothetical protein